MLELLRQPWPWYFSGAAIAFIMILLLVFGKSFGVSANLQTMCTLIGAGKRVKFFDVDWKTEKWNLLFLFGAVLGGVLASSVLSNDEPLNLSAATVRDLNDLGVRFDGGLNPSVLFGAQSLTSPRVILVLLGGGFLVGFGARYAGGCTSGHAISGLSNLQVPSLVAVVGFFLGGLIMTHLLLPYIL